MRVGISMYSNIYSLIYGVSWRKVFVGLIEKGDFLHDIVVNGVQANTT